MKDYDLDSIISVLEKSSCQDPLFEKVYLEKQPRMSVEQFNHIIESRCEKIRAVLEKKAEEYARGDRLSNFRIAAFYLGQSSEQALLGMAVKHFVAIRDFVFDLNSDLLQSEERWDEKIGDMINYLILLEAFIFERHQIKKGEIDDPSRTFDINSERGTSDIDSISYQDNSR